MIQQPPRRANQKINPLLKLSALRLPIHAAHQQPNGLIMKGTQLFGNLKNLNRQLPRRQYDNNPRPILLLKLKSIKQLDTGDEIGEGLAGACLGGAQHVTTF